MINVKSPMQ